MGDARHGRFTDRCEQSLQRRAEREALHREVALGFVARCRMTEAEEDGLKTLSQRKDRRVVNFSEDEKVCAPKTIRVESEAAPDISRV
mgnify:CR=1 FL=1